MNYLRQVKGRVRESDNRGWLSTMPILADMLPHYWREEAENQPEWWIRTGRSIGLHGSFDPLADSIGWRLTRDADDEATITWPGKPKDHPLQAAYQDGEWYFLPPGAMLPVKPGGGRLMLKEVSANEAEKLKIHPDIVT